MLQIIVDFTFFYKIDYEPDITWQLRFKKIAINILFHINSHFWYFIAKNKEPCDFKSSVLPVKWDISRRLFLWDIESCINSWLGSLIELQSFAIQKINLYSIIHFRSWKTHQIGTEITFDLINLFLPIFSKHSQENNSIYWCESKFNFILNMRKSIKCLIPMRMWAISRSHSLFIQSYESYSHNIVDGSLGNFIKIDLFYNVCKKILRGKRKQKKLSS